MPIYEYLCQRCKLKFELLHRNREDLKPFCPECGSEEVEKLFSMFGFSSEEKFVSSSSRGKSCSTCQMKNCSSCE